VTDFREPQAQKLGGATHARKERSDRGRGQHGSRYPRCWHHGAAVRFLARASKRFCRRSVTSYSSRRPSHSACSRVRVSVCNRWMSQHVASPSVEIARAADVWMRNHGGGLSGVRGAIEIACRCPSAPLWRQVAWPQSRAHAELTSAPRRMDARSAFTRWARSIGPNTEGLVTAEQGFRTCLGMLRLF
jgi:hypothetical protein